MKSLFDIQVNGFAGVDFQQSNLVEADARRAVDALATHETLRFFATLISDTIEGLCAKFQNMERIRLADPVVRQAVCGYHLEGPWLSSEPGYHGAHDAKLMRRPNLHDFDRLQHAAGGNIRLVTLAPELPDACAFIRALVQQGVHVSLGHTNASLGEIDHAIDAGAKFCTHVGNGVPMMLHRHDNVIQRLLSRDELFAFFIPDGIHVPPHVLQNYLKAKRPEARLFTTDCMSAAGARPGRHRLGELQLEVGEDRVVRNPATGQFAGSALCPDQGVTNLQTWFHLSRQTARDHFSTLIAKHFKIELPEINDSFLRQQD